MAPKHYRPAGKKKEGNAARYVTRSQAVKSLQVNLPLFRKLSILKGVFPREPKKKVKGNHHTYYHTKDIAFLQHEPLLEKFREQKAHEKKIKKALGKKQKDHAYRLRQRAPKYKLDRLIRERYPKFVDALRDLDDCLTMVHLFAMMPASDKDEIRVELIHNCRRLSHEWQAYISRTHKLRKTFLSVKGIYYQAEVDGQKITWLTPHGMQQILTDDVDYKVMQSFLELYEHLLGFVNFHLYTSINVPYPPILDPRLEALAVDLYALSRCFDAASRARLSDSQSAGSSGADNADIQSDASGSELRLAQLQHHLPSNEPGALMHIMKDANSHDEDDEETKQCKSLFKGLKFFLSREVPRESLLFVIPAFGGMVSWEGDGSPLKEADQSITHQIVDRPIQGHKFLSRDYVQPQWVYDSVNARIILPTEGYTVGRVPPPHLSPFVDNEAEGYVPEYAETIKRLQAAASKEVLPMPGAEMEDFADPKNLFVEGVVNRAEANEAAEKKRKMAMLEKKYLEELKMEADLGSVSTLVSSTNGQVNDTEAVVDEESLPDAELVAQDIASMSTVVMSRKKRGLYKSMQIGKQRKQAKVNQLKERKKKIEQSQRPGGN